MPWLRAWNQFHSLQSIATARILAYSHICSDFVSNQHSTARDALPRCTHVSEDASSFGKEKYAGAGTESSIIRGLCRYAIIYGYCSQVEESVHQWRAA